MKTIYLFISLFLAISFSLFAQENPSELKPDVQVLMHNPSGIRIEYNITNQELELWISPQAGKEDDYWMRNFSNRDDHTRLFDKISFPALSLNKYEKVEYDPFHSIIHFKNQTMHLATVFDKPGVMLWFEKPEMVDFKSDKQDAAISRKDKVFHIMHPDRGLTFEYIAQLGHGQGSFRHQLQIDRGRSIYARANLKAGQVLYIGGELAVENVPEMMNEFSNKTPEQLLNQTNKKVNKILSAGKVDFKENEKLENLVHFNKRIWVSAQDLSGALHASIKRIYYLIWVREGGLACPWMGYSGWIYPLEKWVDFQMENPTEISDEGPGGRFFGQLVNKKITKWQEDGEFYAIWSAFTHWTQTGDKKFVSGENLELMRDAMNWLERYAFDEEKGVFFRYYYCETPLMYSRDYNWDNAVGKPVLNWDPAPYKGKMIKKSYDIYVNLLNYSVYRMLESMCIANNIENNYGEKAEKLAESMKHWFEKDGLPMYGHVISTDDEEISADPYGMDETDYIWALTCPPFYPDYIDIKKLRTRLFEDLQKKKDGYFLAAYFSILGALDLLENSEEEIIEATTYAAKECYIPWEDIPLAGSMVEMSGYYPPGHGHHIRPQMFTMGAWFGAMSNLGIHRLPFGLRIQPCKSLQQIEKYQYQGKSLDIKFSGKGENIAYSINGQPVKYSLQIPEQMLNKEKNNIVVSLSNAADKFPLLIKSSIRLLDVSKSGKDIKYHCRGYGNSFLHFMQGKHSLEVKIVDKNGEKLDFIQKQKKDLLQIHLQSSSEFDVIIGYN